MILKDLLQPNLDIVFCGTAAGEVSAQKQAYYAGPGNQFYPVLYKSGLTPKLLYPNEYRELLSYNIGLTDLVKLTSGNDNVLNKSDYDAGSFVKKILKYQPKLVCFNGKKAAAEYMGSKTKYIDYGLMTGTIGESKLYCAPSTSGSARKFWEEQYWFDLRKILKE
ncbi:mismatch-specific DNA-glycosylase [Arenibacter sp. TNZ]|uniref:mismatch-specific DNA-glycosylase n=1 Tax=Arenibacter TaxID=178469 RepID=UPI000CD47927|nr:MULTISPECIES: mismatch-specific DNA-glycosylase [Arenibacter]MCM4171845.1 mismatch-specific DNA-glycosylase [Arenibacter sp. TNZ]